MRIVHADNWMWRRYGKNKYSSGRNLFLGGVRNNWRMFEFSDRDIAHYESPLGIRPLGEWRTNRRLVETCDNLRPDLLVVGHCDIIWNRTLLEIRRLVPGIRIACWNVDPLFDDRNVGRIRRRMDCSDALFVTTAGAPLRQFCTGRNAVAFMPNPTDPAEEDQDNSRKTAFERDLVFCSGRPTTDARNAFVGRLHAAIDGRVRFESFGMHGPPSVWGRAYEQVLAGSKMGLNMNHIEDWPLYSSDRIAQLMGNGLLTFILDKGQMRRLFRDEHVGFFTDLDDLARLVLAFQADDARRQAVAAAGRAYYHEHFSGQRIMSFIVETTFGLPYSHNYLWADELYR